MPTKLQVSTLFKGVRDTYIHIYIRVPSSTTRDSILHKMEKSGNFLSGSKGEGEEILRKSNNVAPSSFFFFHSNSGVFYPFSVLPSSLSLCISHLLVPLPLAFPFSLTSKPRRSIQEPSNFLLIFHLFGSTENGQ